MDNNEPTRSSIDVLLNEGRRLLTNLTCVILKNAIKNIKRQFASINIDIESACEVFTNALIKRTKTPTSLNGLVIFVNNEKSKLIADINNSVFSVAKITAEEVPFASNSHS